MYKICLICVGLVIFNLMNNIFIYPPTDGYMKKQTCSLISDSGVLTTAEGREADTKQ